MSLHPIVIVVAVATICCIGEGICEDRSNHILSSPPHPQLCTSQTEVDAIGVLDEMKRCGVQPHVTSLYVTATSTAGSGDLDLQRNLRLFKRVYGMGILDDAGVTIDAKNPVKFGWMLEKGAPRSQPRKGHVTFSAIKIGAIIRFANDLELVEDSTGAEFVHGVLNTIGLHPDGPLARKVTDSNTGYERFKF